MSISTTVIITDADKTAAISAIDSACGLAAPFTYANDFSYELTDGTDTFWAMSGWANELAVQALVNGGYVHYAAFPANLDGALEANSLTIANG